MTTFTSYNVISAYKCRNCRGFSHHPGWQPEWCCQLAGHVLFFSTEKSRVFKLDMSVKVFGTIDTEYLGKHCLGEFIHMKSSEWLVGFAILLNRKSKVYRYDCMSKPVLTHLQVKQIDVTCASNTQGFLWLQFVFDSEFIHSSASDERVYVQIVCLRIDG